jgi:putative Holliday junction resolvase
VARILAVDYGERRIGLAVSDPTATIAQPLETLVRRRGKRPPVAAVLELARAQDVEEIVVGLPLTLEGDDSDWTTEVRAFANTLGERSGLSVHMVDERFTSAQAGRVVRSLGLKRSAREEKSRVDSAAAMLILQAHLDARKRG